MRGAEREAGLRLQASGFRLRAAGAGFVSTALVFCSLGASAQDELFITVSAPIGPTTSESAPKEEGLPFITVSSPAIQAPGSEAPLLKPSAPGPAAAAADPASKPSSPMVQSESALRSPIKQEQKVLRDPFWPIGFFPPDWNRPAADAGRRPEADEAGWSAAAKKIRISGTSQMAGRTAAIVNGDLKLPGDRIEVTHESRTYSWAISGIEADGRIQLKRDKVN